MASCFYLSIFTQILWINYTEKQESVDIDEVKESIISIQTELSNYSLKDIYNVDEAGLSMNLCLLVHPFWALKKSQEE